MSIPRAAAQTETLVANFFPYGKDGVGPAGNLAFDKTGKIYGATEQGGTNRLGTVFELVPTAGGGWVKKIIYNFSGADGSSPRSGVTLDASGNLYGTTVYGGAYGDGTVYRLSPGAGGVWTQTVLHSFSNTGGDGENPYSRVIFDAAGNLYGALAYGGGGCPNYGLGCGLVFELSPQSDGSWTETFVHSFSNNGTDGLNPFGDLIFDAKGNLYGSTNQGGSLGGGTVFELSPQAGGVWGEEILHNFSGISTDGNFPYGGVILDAKGNLYGTTYEGGVSGGTGNGGGIVFELSPAHNGSWTENILYVFPWPSCTNGCYPQTSLTLDAKGDLYGTTSQGAGAPGLVFELQPATAGAWTESVVHSFGIANKDGDTPSGSLILRPSGLLFGTTLSGGEFGGGSVYSIKP